MNTIKETLEYIVKSIVPETENLIVNEIEENNTHILEIDAPTEVIGKIIGKEGKIIKSIRSILSLSYPNTRFIVKIKE
jgi:hypothetical protein